MAYAGFRQIFGPLIKRKVKEVRGVENLPAAPPFIVAANHVGYLDAMAIALFILEKYKSPAYFLTQPVMWKMWGKYLARHWLAMIPRIDNDKAVTWQETINHLTHGDIVGVFPEGTRNAHNPDLLKAKTGAVRMCLESGAPIVPIGLFNDTGHRIGRAFRSLFENKSAIKINIGKPIYLGEYRHKPIDKPLLESASRELMVSIGELCGKKYPF